MIKFIDLDKENLISAIISDKVTKEDVNKVHKLIHKIINDGNQVDFYFEMKGFAGYTFKGFIEDLKVDKSHSSDYGKMAFVGENKLQELVTKITDFFMKSEVKYFNAQEKEKAKVWIKL